MSAPASGASSNWPVQGVSGEAAQTAESLFNQGLDCHDRGQYDDAIRCYQEAVNADPNMVVAHNNLGMVYIDKGMFQEAIGSLKRTVELEPSYAEAYNNLGFVYRRTGDEGTGAAYYVKFLELAPDVEDAGKIRAWVDQVRSRTGELPPLDTVPTAGEPGVGRAAAQGVQAVPSPPAGAQAAPSPPAQTEPQYAGGVAGAAADARELSPDPQPQAKEAPPDRAQK